MTKGWAHYDATYDIIPKKAKGTHVFQPSDGSQGVAFNNIGQNQSATSPAPSVGVCPASLKTPPQSSTGNNISSPVPPPPTSPVPHPHSISSSIMTTSSKHEYSAHESANSSPNTFVNDLMSISGSSSSQANSK